MHVKVQGIKFQVPIKKFGIGLWASVSGVNYEPDLKKFLGQLSPGYIVIDLGANVGAYTLRSAKAVGNSGKVIAVEPIPSIFKNLTENIRLNNFSNIIPINAAAGEKNGLTNLNFGIDGYNSSSIVREESGHSIQVKVVSLDSVIQTHEIHRLDIVKMDIEGAEAMAIHGMSASIKKFKPLIVFENNPEARNALESLGYECGYFTHKDEWIPSSTKFNLWARPKSHT